MRRKPPKGWLSLLKTALSLPEVIEDDVQIGWGGERAAQVRIDDAAGSRDGRIVPEIVRGFQSRPGRVRGFVNHEPVRRESIRRESIRLGPITLEPIRLGPIRLGLTGNLAEACGCGCAEQDCVHGQCSTAN